MKQMLLFLTIGMALSINVHAEMRPRPRIVHQYCHVKIVPKRGPNKDKEIIVSNDYCGEANGTGNVFATCCGQLGERIKRAAPRVDPGLCFQTRPAKKGGC